MFAVIGQRSRQRYRDRAQQVVLACATWDSDGRLLVTPEGFLPCRKITNIYIDKVCESFDILRVPVADVPSPSTMSSPSNIPSSPGYSVYLVVGKVLQIWSQECEITFALVATSRDHEDVLLQDREAVIRTTVRIMLRFSKNISVLLLLISLPCSRNNWRIWVFSSMRSWILALLETAQNQDSSIPSRTLPKWKISRLRQ